MNPLTGQTITTSVTREAIGATTTLTTTITTIV
jgi:hypothetical protein